MIGGVFGYVYGNVTLSNVTVQNSKIIGYGKVGAFIGMGADPNVHITFENCTSKDNQIYGVYNVGGFAGNIQRTYTGVDNTKFVGENVSSSKILLPTTQISYVTITATITYRVGDISSGAPVEVPVSGTYVDLYEDSEGNHYYYAAEAVYYVSYGGNNGFDPHWEGNKYIANSEYCVDTPEPFTATAPQA